MIRELVIKNYKSVLSQTIPLSRLTILIGENGAGKSNILESIVLAAAAASNKLDTEYLTARGVRLTEARLMKSAFDATTKSRPITIDIETDNPLSRESTRKYHFVLRYDDRAEVNNWVLDSRSEFPTFGPEQHLTGLLKKSKIKKPSESLLDELRVIADALTKAAEHAQSSTTNEKTQRKFPEVRLSLPVAQIVGLLAGKFSFERFTVYSPSHDVLRNTSITPPTSPLGPRGEGLLSTLSILQTREPERFKDVIKSLELFGWFKAIRVPEVDRGKSDLEPNGLSVTDRYIRSRGLELSDLSVNEGFLFVLFYFTLVCSNGTPQMFAIENIETALNPRLCEVVVKRLYELAKKYDKQIILTTHNPAVLDALNLDDPEQSLIVVRRNSEGHTSTMRYRKPRASEERFPVRLSEAFLKGHIGALPKGI